MELDPSVGEGPRLLYALHDIQFNVLGIVDEDGDLVERYEYGAYGQRSVYIPTGDADRFPDDAGYYACTYKAGTSQRASTGGGGTTYGHALNPIGFQGLYHDEETASSGSAWHGGIIHNRYRAWHTTLGRFNQRDPLGYPDGLNAYAGYHVMHGGVDPWGMEVWHHLLTKFLFDPADKNSLLNELGLSFSEGIDLHSAEYGWVFDNPDHHNRLHQRQRGRDTRTWNRRQADWLRGLEREGVKTITPERLKTHLDDMKRDFGLTTRAGNPRLGLQATQEWSGTNNYYRELDQQGRLLPDRATARHRLPRKHTVGWIRRASTRVVKVFTLAGAIGGYWHAQDQEAGTGLTVTNSIVAAVLPIDVYDMSALLELGFKPMVNTSEDFRENRDKCEREKYEQMMKEMGLEDYIEPRHQ